jgi:membrane protein
VHPVARRQPAHPPGDRAVPARRRRPRPRGRSLWRLGGLSFAELGRRLYRSVNEDEVLDRAAALSYYFMFALFPLLLFLTALVGLLPADGLIVELMAWAAEVLPADTAALIERILKEIVAGAGGGLLSLGAAMALWTASLGMASIMTGLNIAFGVEDPRSWWWRRLVAIGLTVGFSVFVLAALLLMVAGPPVAETLAERVGLGKAVALAWQLATLPVGALFVLTAIALVYNFAPARRRRWRWATPGAVVALAAWLASSVALRLYVTHFGDFNRAYGSIGAVILLMVWFYLTGLALLLGAEIDHEIEEAAHERAEAEARAEAEVAVPDRRGRRPA